MYTEKWQRGEPQKRQPPSKRSKKNVHKEKGGCTPKPKKGEKEPLSQSSYFPPFEHMLSRDRPQNCGRIEAHNETQNFVL